MHTPDFHTRIAVKATAPEAFRCINSVKKWWTENLEGSSENPGDEFTVRFGDVHYSRQKIVEFIPGKTVTWLVTDSKLNFLENRQEWTNTRIRFDILSDKGKTEIHFTHLGLVPEIECFNACSNAWNQYIRQSLLSLVNTGKGQPEPKEETE